MVMNLSQVVSRAFTLDDFAFTYLLSGPVTIVNVGAAVTQDPATASTFRLTNDNDVVMGQLFSFEDRVVLGIKVGGILRKFKDRLPAAIGHNITIGSAVSGSAVLGEVKLATVQTEPKPNRVVELGVDFVVVEYL